MKSRKIITGALLIYTLTLSTGTVLATNVENIIPINDISGINQIMAESSQLDVIEQSNFKSLMGEVKEIKDFQGVEGSKFVTIENVAEQIENIIVSNDTYILGDAEIEIGSIVTGYYDANAPMIMIYPPQYNVEVVVIEEEKEKMESIRVDLFDENLISADNTLKINLSDDTKTIFRNGEKFEGDLTNRKLAVIYSSSTRSIPAQTTPTKIIVLSEEEVEEIEEIAVITSNDVSSMDIIVDNRKIEASSAYMNEEDVVMVPLRVIAEALGLKVSWEAETRSVKLGNVISLAIGEDNYTYMKMAPIQLGTAPEIIDGITFVPLNFFRAVMGMNNAYVFGGQIIIDDGELMY